MASASRAMAQQVICSICQISLLEQRNGQNQVVATSTCGHVFHKTCIEEWRRTSIRNTGNVSCPKCRKWFPTYGEYSLDLFLDSEGNAEYTKLEKAKRTLQNEKATLSNDLRKLKETKVVLETERKRLLEKTKRLENENRILVDEKWLLATDNERKLKAINQAIERNTRISTENEKLVAKNLKLVEEIELLREGQKKAPATDVSSELRKRMITAEIKVILLTNADLLEETYGDLKWSDLTDTYHKELLRKLQIRGFSSLNFDEDLPINSKALLRLIKAGEKDEMLLQNMIEDYFEEMVELNGKVSWDDLGNSLRQYLISKLRESSQVGSLQLTQVPISSNIVARLINDNTGGNPNLLGEIVTKYLECEVKNWSVDVVNDLLKVALLELINDQIIDEIVLVNHLNSESWIVPILMRQKRPFEYAYEFEHDTVKYWVIGMMIGKLMEQIKVSRINAVRLIHKGCMSADSLGIYFVDYMSEAEPSNVTNFDEVDDTLTGLILMLCIMKLPALQPLITVLKYFESRNLLEIAFPDKSSQSEDLSLTLLHAATIRGNLEVVKCLLYQFGFSKQLTHPPFQNLMVSCVENTKNCRAEQIQEREEIINELIKLNKNYATWDISSGRLDVHEGLLKFLKGLGSQGSK